MASPTMRPTTQSTTDVNAPLSVHQVLNAETHSTFETAELFSEQRSPSFVTTFVEVFGAANPEVSQIPDSPSSQAAEPIFAHLLRVTSFTPTATLPKHIRLQNPGEDDTEISIGRNNDNTVQLDSYELKKLLSFYHAKIIMINNAHYVVALETVNATWVNGEPLLPLTPSKLVDGYKVCFGGPSHVTRGNRIFVNPFCFVFKRKINECTWSRIKQLSTQAKKALYDHLAARNIKSMAFAEKHKIEAQIERWKHEIRNRQQKIEHIEARVEKCFFRDEKKDKREDCETVKKNEDKTLTKKQKVVQLDEREMFEQLKCPICLQVKLTPCSIDACGHTFCYLCISPHLLTKRTCPICKRDNVRPWNLTFNFCMQYLIDKYTEGKFSIETNEMRKCWLLQDKKELRWFRD